MEKRQLILNDYKTWETGLWTLASCNIMKADQVQTFVDVPGRFAPLNLSTALTDGQPYYGSASLEAVLESSEGSREERQQRIEKMVNLLDGYQVKIVHPDRPGSYMIGTVQIRKQYNDLVHCAVTVSAICEAWLYNEEETVVSVGLEGTAEPVVLLNRGRLEAVPEIDVTGSALIAYDDSSISLSKGKHIVPWLSVPATGGPASPNSIVLSVSGSGTLTFTYREAVLAE